MRYTHYALMVYGYGRIPIVDWLDKQARLGLAHAREVASLDAYYELLALVKDRDVRLEDFARASICEELSHRDEVDKMLRKPGSSGPFEV